MIRFSGFCGRHREWANGFTGLVILFGTFWGLGSYPLADPLVGLLITIAVLK
ncbi:MAG: hypothetical protein NHB15_00470 [Methanosarcina barkeri]|nr:hypothetical protein [Methanosarcina sp. ERenArc_MAG2]